MYRFFRSLLFILDPETAHHLTFRILRLPGFAKIFGNRYNHHPLLERQLFGLTFPNPVGLAAGLDKDALAFEELGELGFGFVEIGTVTPRPQPGNDKPRLFRLKSDSALINRMGFNNRGVEAAAAKLRKRSKKSNLIIGGNIGKNKTTPNNSASDDYASCFEALHPLVDYFVVNVSSPNTPNLRELQDKEPLKKLLAGLQLLNSKKSKPKPILLKIAPDLSNQQLDDIVEIALEIQLDGLIATNTTIDRSGLQCSPDELQKIGAGGLSGKPLADRSTEVIRYLRKKAGASLPIIGVGGIHSADDALAKLEAGADLIQLYTGFIYEGPRLIAKINKTLLNKTNT